MAGMVTNYFPLIFSVIIAFTYYYTNRLYIKNKPYYQKILSFAAGISITYVLLELFPTFTEVALEINKFLFVSILLGFIIHHLIEKEIYLHNKKHELMKLLSMQENIFSFIYHIILGIILVTLYKGDPVEGVLAFVPILTFTLASTLPMKPHPTRLKALFMSSSTIIGVLVALLWTSMPLWLEFFLIGLATGVLLYTIIRHQIPFGSEGRIGYFTLGFTFYALFIMMTWYI